MRIITFCLLFIASFACAGSNKSDKRGGDEKIDQEGSNVVNRPDFSCESFKSSKNVDGANKELLPAALGSENLADAFCLYTKRRESVLRHLMDRYQGAEPSNKDDDNRGNFSNFIRWAQAAILLQDDKQIAAINKVLESSKAEPWNYGSSFEFPGCSRKGDYDFVAFGIATVALLSDAAEMGLSEKAREKLVKDLLPEYGNPPLEHKTKFKLEGLLCGSLMVPETENHVLMVNISKYLTNQLRGVDNSKNGFDLWMREHMDIFLDEFFDEYNSRPYQQYALAPILSVAALTKSQEVRNAALNVIEQSLATIALQSNGLRRFSPFRRQPQYKDSTASFDGNGVMGLAAIYTGKYEKLLANDEKNLGTSIIASAVLFESVPLRKVVVSLFTDRDKISYEQEIFYPGNEEHYSATPDYLLSSAGRYHAYESCPEASIVPGVSGCLTDQQNGWAGATVLVPTVLDSSELTDMIHFKGNSSVTKRNSNCVKNGFACGLRPSIPDWITSTCSPLVDEEWLFIDMKTNSNSACNHGYFVAIKSKDGSGILDVESAPSIAYQSYRETLKTNNPDSVIKGQEASFTKFDGTTIAYLISDDYSVGSNILPRQKTTEYTLRGDLMDNSTGTIVITAPSINESIELEK